jgi:phosphoadenylyl-sulfate reductase (thioredoxin)
VSLEKDLAMAVEVAEKLLEHLEHAAPEELFRWAQQEYGTRAGIITSFQDTGCVMIDIMCRTAPGMRVITIDTLRLHEETYALMREIEERYGIRIERFTPDPERLRRMIEQHGEYLFFDSKAKQEFCCHVRKVEPNQRALETLDVWFTGLRRDHSEFRSNTPKVQWVERAGRKILKIAPLVDWTQEQVDAYIREHGVPKNKLYDMGYTSIGCIICTTPTLPHEDKRAGRWRWFNALGDKTKECGIHINGSGI